jgi:hypothetical protein
VLDDYNPPPIEVEMKLLSNQLSALSNEFLIQSKQAVLQMSQIQTDTSWNIQSNYTSTYINKNQFTSDTTLLFDSETFGGSMSIYPLMLAIQALAVFAIICDYIYRVYSSGYLFYKYIKSPAQQLPPIDVRDDKYDDITPTQRTLWWTVQPWFVYAIIIIILAWALGVIIIAYIPIQAAYDNGCVASTNGTLLTNNAYVLLYNYASLKGNKRLLEGMILYEGKRAEICGRETAISAMVNIYIIVNGVHC